MATVDSLDIKISAQANSASASIDKLVGKLNTLSSSLNRINGSGLTGLANGVQKLGNAMQVMNAVKTADFTRLANNLTKLSTIDTASINKAASSVTTIAKSFNSIGNLSKSAEQLGQLASGIKQLGYTSATKAIQNIPKLATSMKTLMSELSGVPRVSQNLIDMTNALARLARTGASSGRAADSLSRSFTNLSASSIRTSGVLRGMQNNFRSLFRSILPFVGVFQLISFGKQATEIASDLTEVQNVVDVTFAQFKDRIEDFADTSIQDFGMSELTAKTIASRFQAMGVAMGFARGEMADMSVSLTALAGDMASFYNVEQEEMAKSLQSIFTGETEPLRRYGLDLANVTVQEWAMKQGLDANMQSMTQAEKTLLRYNYVLANTVDAQGDFARTANSWANSIRVLKQSFEALGSIVGQVLINVFKPFVQALNSVMQKVIQFARVVANALGKIFGWKLEINTTGVTDDIGGIADYADQAAGGLESGSDAAKDEADNIDKAQKAAKKLKDYTLGIDELNIIRPEDVDALDNMTNSLDKIDKPSGGAGGTGTGGGGGDVASSLTKTDSIFKEFESEIDSLYELGEYIGKVLTDAMNSIDWDSIYEKARNFGKGLADFLNGLISPELFGALGRTIAGSLNTALHFLDSFGETFDWEDFGLSIATGINEFFATFDFALLAHTINTWAHGILNTIITFLDKTDWNMIGTRIGTFLAELDFVGVGKKVGKAIWKAINAGIDLWKGMFNAAPFETIIITLAGLKKAWESVIKVKVVPWIKGIVDGFKTISTSISALAGSNVALATLTTDFPKLAKAIEVTRQAFANFRFGIENGNFFTGLNEGISTIRNNLTGMQKGIITAAAAFLEFNVVSDVFEGLTLGAEGVVEGLLKIGATVAAAGAAMYVAFGPAGLAIAAITGVVAAIKGIGDAFNEIQENASLEAVGNALRNPGGVPLEEITNSYQAMISSISDGFSIINEKSEELGITRENIQKTTDNINLIQFAMENSAASVSEKIPEIQEQFQLLVDNSRTLFDQEYDIIMTALAGSLGEAAEQAGISISEFVGHLDQLKSDYNQSLEEIQQSNQELEQQLEAGTISQQEYITKLNDNYSKIAELTGKTDEYKTSVDNVSQAVEGVDFSKFVSDDNILNVSALRNEFDVLATTAGEAKETINSSGEEVTTSLENMMAKFQSFGDLEGVGMVSKTLEAENQNISDATTSVDIALTKYADQVQTGLLEKIPSVIDSALADYENQSWIYKLTHSEEEHVGAALEEYQANVIDVAVSELESMYGNLGIEGVGWASEAGKSIIDSLYDTTIESSYEGVEIATTTLNDNYRAIVEGAIEGIEDIAKDGGKYTIEGYNKGIEENKSTSKEKVSTWMSEVEKAIHDSKMQFGSPSITAWNFGKDTITGFNNGILENSESTKTVINTWLESVAQLFTVENWISKFEGIKEAFILKWQEITEWLNSEFLPTWFEEGILPWFSFEKWHDELLINIPLAFQTTWEELLAWWNEEAMTVWWEEYVIPWFEVERWKLQFTNILTALKTVWQEIVITWNKQLDDWWKNNVLPRFTFEKWKTMLIPVKNAFQKTFEEITEIVNEQMEKAYNYVADWCSQMSFEIDAVLTKIASIKTALSSIGGMGVGASISIGAKQYAAGGFPDSGDFFFANENGIPELVGTIGGRTAVASGTEITGISSAVYSTGETQASLLSTAVALLRIIADKDPSVSIDGRELVNAYSERKERNGYNFS